MRGGPPLRLVPRREVEAREAADGRGRIGSTAQKLRRRRAGSARSGSAGAEGSPRAGCSAEIVREVVLVGIAGPSGVGKSTLARRLVEELNTPLAPVGMDWFLMPQWMPRDPEGGRNWESPEGVDFVRLRRELLEAAAVLSRVDRVPKERQPKFGRAAPHCNTLGGMMDAPRGDGGLARLGQMLCSWGAASLR